MRKLISVCVVAAIVISMFAFAPIVSSAAEPAKLIDFYYEDLYKQHLPTGENECTVEWKDNALLFTANTEDTELGDTYFSVGGAGNFEADDNQWMVIKLKNLSDVSTFELHYGTSLYNVAGNTVAHFDISAKDSDYKTYVIDIAKANLDTAYALNGPDGIAQQAGSTDTPISELTESTWQGTVTSLRLDCLYKEGKSGMVPDGSEMYIEYIAFFGSEADAKAFSASGPDRSGYVAPPTAAPIEGDDANPNYDAVILFKEDGDWEDYISVDGNPINQMISEGANEAGDAILFTVEKGNDPWVQLMPLVSVDGEDWPVIQMKVRKSAGSPNSGQMYYTTDLNPNLGEAQTATIKYANTSDWQIINIDLNENKNDLCAGNYTILRLDVFTNSPDEYEFEIAYIAFFKSVDAAEQYVAKGGDFSELASMTPAPSEKTPTPVPATQKPTPTKAATPTPAKKDDASKTGMSTTTIVIIVVAAVVVVGAVTAFLLVKKKKNKGPNDNEDNADHTDHKES